MATFLRCNEGTLLNELAKAAIEAAEGGLRALPSTSAAIRLFFVLNTDGEASDGVLAAKNFNDGYNGLLEKFPSMQQARTFVLGIGS